MLRLLVTLAALFLILWIYMGGSLTGGNGGGVQEMKSRAVDKARSVEALMLDQPRRVEEQLRRIESESNAEGTR